MARNQPRLIMRLASGCHQRCCAFMSTAATTVRETPVNDVNPPPTYHQPAKPELSRAKLLEVQNCDAFQKIDLSFSNCKEAYKSRNTFHLLRALLVFKLCSYDWVVDNSMRVMRQAKKILGKRLFEVLAKGTIYGHFVAGEDEESIRPTIEHMRMYGVKSILDYSVEADLSPEQAIRKEMGSCEAKTGHTAEKRFQAYKMYGDRRKHVISARTYFYESEAQCERNAEIIMNSIDAVSGVTNCTGFAAIKLTALGKPQLLMQLSDAIVQTRKLFEDLCGTVNREYIFTHKISREYFHQRLKQLGVAVTENVADDWFLKIDDDKDNMIDMSDWHMLLNFDFEQRHYFAAPDLKSGSFQYFLADITKEEAQSFTNLVDRLQRICEFAQHKDVRLMIDAEQSYFQPAISRLVFELMKKFNREKAIVFGTYQCYMKDAISLLATDLLLAKKQNLYFGAKLVRGAYMEQERGRARDIGYEDPINATYEKTTEMYDRCLSECMSHISDRGGQRVAIMVASHNEDTVRNTIHKMQEFGILPDQKVICFGQLLGMCDQVSYSLGQAGFSVYKYVPYGPVGEVLPYLSRRAQENRSLLKGAEKERGMLKEELWRRVRRGEVFMKPVPPTNPS